MKWYVAVLLIISSLIICAMFANYAIQDNFEFSGDDIGLSIATSFMLVGLGTAIVVFFAAFIIAVFNREAKDDDEYWVWHLLICIGYLFSFGITTWYTEGAAEQVFMVLTLIFFGYHFGRLVQLLVRYGSGTRRKTVHQIRQSDYDRIYGNAIISERNRVSRIQQEEELGRTYSSQPKKSRPQPPIPKGKRTMRPTRQQPPRPDEGKYYDPDGDEDEDGETISQALVPFNAKTAAENAFAAQSDYFESVGSGLDMDANRI